MVSTPHRLVILIALAALASGCKSTLDADQPRPYPCDPVQPSEGQCPGDWLCGLDRLCHDASVGIALSCVDDSNCTGGWRCAFGGSCVDASNTALVAGVTPSAPQPLNPRPSWTAPPAPFSATRAFTLARVDGADLTVISPSGTARAQLVAPVDSVQLLNDDLVYVSDADGLARVDAATGALTRLTTTGTSVGKLRVAPGPYPVVLALSSAATTLVRADGTVGSDATKLFTDAAPAHTWAGPDTFLALGADGLYAANREPAGAFLDAASDLKPDPTWFPVSLPGIASHDQGCPASTDVLPTHVRSLFDPQNTQWFLAARFADGSAPTVSVYQIGPLNPVTACESLAATTLVERCPACSAGATLLDFHPSLDDQAQLGVYTRCVGKGVVTEHVVTATSEGCSIDQGVIGVPLAATPMEPRPDGFGWASAQQVGLCDPFVGETNVFSCRTQFPALEPHSVFRYDDGAIGAATRDYGNSRFDQLEEVGLWASASRDSRVPYLQKAVIGKPTWVTQVTPSAVPGAFAADIEVWAVDDVRAPYQKLPIAVAQNQTSALDPTFFFALPSIAHFIPDPSADPKAEDTLVVTAGDAIKSVRLPRTPPTDLRRLETRIVPAPQLTIESLDFKRTTATGPGVPYLEGAVIARQRVFSLTAANPIRWTTSELAIPVHTAPVDVFFSGTRGRLVYRDGSVYSIPELVRVADPPLVVENAFHADVPGAQTADFAQVCGNIYALPDSGALYRLVPETANGHWERIPLGDPNAPLGYGTLHPLGSTLVITTTSGAVYEVEHPGCTE